MRGHSLNVWRCIQNIKTPFPVSGGYNGYTYPCTTKEVSLQEHMYKSKPLNAVRLTKIKYISG
jgi:hypothetical protein